MENITPMSDHLDYYKQLCIKASQDDEIFKDFRRDKIYRLYVDYFSYEVGDYCFNYIFDNPYINFTNKELKEFLNNDNYGTPLMYDYYNYLAKAICSATTLKYIKTFIDLHQHFDFKSINYITEIGCGYGGQCRIILSKYPNIKYAIIDFPEVIELTKKYLSVFDTPDFKYTDRVNFISSDNLANSEVHGDLVISDYCFSELTKKDQDMYLKKVISKHKNGYITWDAECFLLLDRYSGYELYEFIKKLDFNVNIEPEKPVSTSKLNKIITFKK